MFGTDVRALRYSFIIMYNVWDCFFINACSITFVFTITKTRLYNFDPRKPQFYIVKLGFTGVYIIFLIFAQKIDCGYPLEPPHRGGSNEYPQSMFWAEIWKISDFFLSENFHFLVVKFSVYLNRHVFVMRFCSTHLCRVDSSDLTLWTDQFLIKGMFGYFCINSCIYAV